MVVPPVHAFSLLPSQLPGNQGFIAGLLKGSGVGSWEDHDLL